MVIPHLQDANPSPTPTRYRSSLSPSYLFQQRLYYVRGCIGFHFFVMYIYQSEIPHYVYPILFCIPNIDVLKYNKKLNAIFTSLLMDSSNKKISSCKEKPD